MTSPPTAGTPITGTASPALSYDDAVARIAALVTDAATAITPNPQLRPFQTVDSPCLNPGESGSKFNGQIKPGRDYLLTGAAGGRSNAALITALDTYWAGQGWRRTSDERPQNQVISYADERTGYAVTAQATGNGDLLLSAGAPCVTPPPGP